jgi:NADPH:quinone reductase-like Zn-dependent oxidoreductase
MTTPKTVWRNTYGGPETLSVREVPLPEPGPGELVVRVRATTVNRTDCGALWGKPYIFRFFVGWPRPRHVATGSDFAGEVTAVGPGVSRFAVGDRVMGFDDNCIGTHAQYVRLSDKTPMARMPDGVSFESAAASMEGAHYARNFLNKVTLKPGDEVLLYGATGAIGSAALPLLKQAGIRVTAVCAREHHTAIAARGADVLLDHTQADWHQALRSQQFAAFFDAVGKRTFGEARQWLRPDGVYVSSELGPWAQNIWYSLVAPLMHGPKVRFPLPLDIPASLDLIVPLLASGQFIPLLDRSYPLGDIQQAFAYVASGQKIGNVILLP